MKRYALEIRHREGQIQIQADFWNTHQPWMVFSVKQPEGGSLEVSRVQVQDVILMFEIIPPDEAPVAVPTPEPAPETKPENVPEEKALEQAISGDAGWDWYKPFSEAKVEGSMAARSGGAMEGRKAEVAHLRKHFVLRKNVVQLSENAKLGMPRTKLVDALENLTKIA